MLEIKITKDELAITQVAIEYDGDIVETIALTPAVMRALAEYMALNEWNN